jgi:hypothetical protein
MIEIAKRAAGCKHWQWRVGMAALAATDRARLFTPNGDLPIRGEIGVRLLSHVYSEVRYAFSEDEVVRRSHEKAYVTMITEDGRLTDNEDDGSNCWVVGFTYLEHLLPDFHDTVTATGLLQVVRSAWMQPRIMSRCSEYEGGVLEWDVPVSVEDNGMRTVVFFRAKTEIEALVLALEAAP